MTAATQTPMLEIRDIKRDYRVPQGMFKDDKIVKAARVDAAAFVGSQGDIRGAKLESAFLHIRSQAPALQASDAQLAQAILAL